MNRAGSYDLIVNSGDITITNGELKHIGSGDLIDNTGNVTISDVTVNLLGYYDYEGSRRPWDNYQYTTFINNTDENAISILLSDNIYSISGTETVPVLLAMVKAKTTQAFLKKMKELKQPLSTTIIQLQSHFKGNYWDYKHPVGKASQTLNCKRPYYMCVIGVNDILSDFNEKFNVHEMNGYQNKYTLTEIKELNPKCSVLVNTCKIGRFRKTNEAIFCFWL
jgi:hypothetical protein